MRIKKGTKVLVEAVIEGDCFDNLPKEECAYHISTSRGPAIAEPEHIFVLASDRDK